MTCTKAQLLVLLNKLEDEILEACQREIDRGQRETCNRILSPLRAWQARIEELAADEIVSAIFK